MALPAGPASSWPPSQQPPQQLPQQVQGLAGTNIPSTAAPVLAVPFGPPKVPSAPAQTPGNKHPGWGATPSHAHSNPHKPVIDALPSSQSHMPHQPQAVTGAAARQGQPFAAAHEAAVAAAGKQPLWRPKPSHSHQHPQFVGSSIADGAWTGPGPFRDPITSSPQPHAAALPPQQHHQEFSAASMASVIPSCTHLAPGCVTPPVSANGPQPVPAPAGLKNDSPATPHHALPKPDGNSPEAPSVGNASRQPQVAAGNGERPASARARCLHDLVQTPRPHRAIQPADVPPIPSSPSPMSAMPTALQPKPTTGFGAVRVDQHPLQQADDAAASSGKNVLAISGMHNRDADNAAQKLDASSAAVMAVEAISGIAALEASAQHMVLDGCKVTDRSDESNGCADGASHDTAGATAKPDTTSGSSQTPMHTCKAEPEQEASLDHPESPSTEQSGQQGSAGCRLLTDSAAAVQELGDAQQQLRVRPILDGAQLGDPSMRVGTHSAAGTGQQGHADAGAGPQQAGCRAGMELGSAPTSQPDAQQPSRCSNIGVNDEATAAGSGQAAHLPEAK